MSDNIFLTVVTRACCRPSMLSNNIQSVKTQTDPDVEQIFILDHKKRGILWANKQFALHTDRCDGLYTCTLDDDSMFIDTGLVVALKQVASDNNNPGVIMVKCHRPQIKPYILPKAGVWGKRNLLRVTSTNGGCFIVRTDWWKKHAHRYGVKAGGDWAFLNALKNDKAVTFHWLDRLTRRAQQLGRGKKFESVGKGWFRQVVKRFGIIEVSDVDWRLRHNK